MSASRHQSLTVRSMPLLASHLPSCDTSTDVTFPVCPDSVFTNDQSSAEKI